MLYRQVKREAPAKDRMKSFGAGWTIHIYHDVHARLLYAMKCADPTEIQMLGEVNIDVEEKQIKIEKFHILRQQVSSGHASFDEKDVALFLSAHKNPEKLKGWIHSHVNMGVFWSGTDDDTIERMVKGSGWLVSIVMTIQGGIKGRLDVSFPVMKEFLMEDKVLSDEMFPIFFFGDRVTYDDIPVIIDYDTLAENEKKEIEKEVKDKVSTRQQSVFPHMVDFTGHQSGFGGTAYNRGLWDREGKGFRRTDASITEILEEKEENEFRCFGCTYDWEHKHCKKGICRDKAFIANGGGLSCNERWSGEAVRDEKDKCENCFYNEETLSCRKGVKRTIEFYNKGGASTCKHFYKLQSHNFTPTSEVKIRETLEDDYCLNCIYDRKQLICNMGIERNKEFYNELNFSGVCPCFKTEDIKSVRQDEKEVEDSANVKKAQRKKKGKVKRKKDDK